MKRFFPMPSAVIRVVVMFLTVVGCSSALADGKIPITTSSEAAKKEYLQGRDLADNLRVTDALAHFDKALALDPTFAIAHLARANASGSPKDFFAHLKMAVAHSGKASEGERLLILANEAGANAHPAKQKEYLEKLVAAYPKDERAHFTLGTYFSGQQDRARAIEHFKHSVALAPTYPPVYNSLGYGYLQMENYTEAEKAFKKYVELIPNDPNPSDSYAELLMKMGQFDQSITYYQKALALDPNFVASYSGLAMDYMQKGAPDEGAAVLKKSYGLARNDGERRTALFNQAVLYVDAGKMELALQELDKSYALAEAAHDMLDMSGDLVAKGNILAEMGKYDEALAAFASAVQKSDAADVSQAVKDNVRLFHHSNLVSVALGRKDLKKAKAEAEEFRKGAEASKNPNQVRQAHGLAGRIALAENDSDKAISELLQSNLQNPYELYRLGQAYQAKGDKAKAKQYYDKAAHFNGLPSLNYAFVRTKAAKMSAAM
jgi:tetratricopeptide (TPR) repeat protein